MPNGGDLQGLIYVSDFCQNMLGGSGIWSTLFPRRTEVKSIVLNVKQTVVCVNWLGLNQRVSILVRGEFLSRSPVGSLTLYAGRFTTQLTPEQQNDRPRPKRFWTDVDQLTLVRSFSEHIRRSSVHAQSQEACPDTFAVTLPCTDAVGDKVIFRNADFAQSELRKMHIMSFSPSLEPGDLGTSGCKPKRAQLIRHHPEYGLEITQHGREKYPVDVMNITGTRTIVKVLWQDGRQTTELAKDLVPYLNLDEYDVCES